MYVSAAQIQACVCMRWHVSLGNACASVPRRPLISQHDQTPPCVCMCLHVSFGDMCVSMLCYGKAFIFYSRVKPQTVLEVKQQVVVAVVGSDFFGSSPSSCFIKSLRPAAARGDNIGFGDDADMSLRNFCKMDVRIHAGAVELGERMAPLWSATRGAARRRRRLSSSRRTAPSWSARQGCGQNASTDGGAISVSSLCSSACFAADVGHDHVPYIVVPWLHGTTFCNAC